MSSSTFESLRAQVVKVLVKTPACVAILEATDSLSLRTLPDRFLVVRMFCLYFTHLRVIAIRLRRLRCFKRFVSCTLCLRLRQTRETA